MDFEKILSMRQSTRKFQEKQITEDQLEKILNAANRAPVGSNKYEDIHITDCRQKGTMYPKRGA